MTKLDRETFFAYVRKAPFGGRLTQQQVDGLTIILTYWESWRFNQDLRFLAYMLATVHHETGGTFAPVREGFASTDAEARQIVRKRKYAIEQGGHVYYGRGFVQLTWLTNYKKMGALLNLDLVGNPDLALDPVNATAILFEGMSNGLSGDGDFTGKALEDYFNATTEDPINARRIVNGTDKAALIAGYYENFMGALKAADVKTPLPVDVKPEDAKPDGGSLAGSTTIWGSIVASGSGIMAGVFGKMDNPYALGFGVIMVIAIVVVIIKRKDIRYKFGA